MRRLVFSTDDVPERERFERWRELGARHLAGVRWEPGPVATPFRGALALTRLGAAALVELRSDGHRAARGGSAADGEVCVVEQQAAVPSRYLAGPRPLACGPGDLLVHTPEARFEEDGPGDWATRLWLVPWRRLLPLLPAGAGPTLHVPHRDGAAALAAMTGDALAGQAAHLEPAAADAAIDSFCRLLAVAAGVAPGAVEGGREALRAAALERARQYVDAHLADPDLSAVGVARAVGVSERQLQRLFEGTGESFARYVLRRRLEEVRAALTRPDARPVTDLALAWGFGSLTAFYRGFHKAYGAAPGELRAALARAG